MSKITRLTKIPYLLQKKRDADKESRKRDDEQKERPPFTMLERPPLEKPKLVSFPKRTHTDSEEDERNFNAREGVGDRLDIKI